MHSRHTSTTERFFLCRCNTSTNAQGHLSIDKRRPEEDYREKELAN